MRRRFARNIVSMTQRSPATPPGRILVSGGFRRKGPLEGTRNTTLCNPRSNPDIHITQTLVYPLCTCVAPM